MLDRTTCTTFAHKLLAAVTVEDQNEAWLLLRDYLMTQFIEAELMQVCIPQQITHGGILTIGTGEYVSCWASDSISTARTSIQKSTKNVTYILPEMWIVDHMEVSPVLLQTLDPYEYVNTMLDAAIKRWQDSLQHRIHALLTLSAHRFKHLFSCTLLHKLRIRRMSRAILKNDPYVDTYVMSPQAFSRLYWFCKKNNLEAWLDINKKTFLHRNVVFAQAPFEEHVIYGIPKAKGHLYIRVDTCVHKSRWAADWLRQLGLCLHDSEHIFSYEFE